jgi:hypothetical protein
LTIQLDYFSSYDSTLSIYLTIIDDDDDDNDNDDDEDDDDCDDDNDDNDDDNDDDDVYLRKTYKLQKITLTKIRTSQIRIKKENKHNNN